MATFHQFLGIIVLLQCTRIYVRLGAPTPPTPRTTTTKTTMDYHAYLKHKRMKKMHFEYYPNYGYEPYWMDGEWVLSTTQDPELKKGGLTTKKPTVCGEECSHLFRRIAHVCGRRSSEIRYPDDGCGVPKTSANCEGKPGDNYDFGYETFPTYCKFLDAQCHAKFYDHTRWVLVHIGKCKSLSNYFKPIWSGDQPVSRMKWYLSSLGSE